MLVLEEELTRIGAKDRGVGLPKLVEDRAPVHRPRLLPFGDEELETVVKEAGDLDLALRGAAGELVLGSNGEARKVRVGSGEIEPSPGGDLRHEGVEVVLGDTKLSKSGKGRDEKKHGNLRWSCGNATRSIAVTTNKYSRF